MSNIKKLYTCLTDDLSTFYGIDGEDALLTIASYVDLAALYKDYPLLQPDGEEVV